MSAASLPPVGIDPNLRNNSGGSGSQLSKWRSESKKAQDRHNAAMPFFLQEQRQEFHGNAKRYTDDLHRKEADRQSKSKEFVVAGAATTAISSSNASSTNNSTNNGSTGLHGGGSSYIPPAVDVAVAPTPPVSRKRRAGDPIQTPTMDFHGTAAAAQMFQRGQMGSGMFSMPRLPPNGSVASPVGYPGYPNGFAPMHQQHMVPQTSQQQQQLNSGNMMPNDRVPSEPCVPDPKSVATPPLFANPSPSTSTPSKNPEATNNSPPNDPTPGSSSQSVAGDGCQLTDCLNVADDHEKTLDDMIKSSLANELTDLGGTIQTDLEDMELTSLLDRIGDLIPVEEPHTPASSAPPSAPTVPTSNDNSPVVPGPMSAPGAFNQIASPASVRSNATPAPSVQTVPVAPQQQQQQQQQNHSPYGAIAPTPPMNNGNAAFSPPAVPQQAPQQNPQVPVTNPPNGGFPMQSPHYPGAQNVQSTPIPYPGQMTAMQMQQQQQQQQYMMQMQMHQMKAFQQHQQHQQQQAFLQKQMQMRMQQHHYNAFHNPNGYSLPMQYPTGVPQQNYHPHHHYPSPQYTQYG